MTYSVFMPQVLKPDVRDAILDAATVCFARQGFHRTSMAAIAREAGISTGNTYRYFPGKRELFEHILPASFVGELEQVLDRRVTALAQLDDLNALDDEALARQADLLTFLVANRLRVVLLLDRCADTPYEDFAERFVQGLVDRALASMERERPVTPHTRLVLRCVFDGARRTIVDVLETHADPTDIAAALASFWTFQIAGLAALRRSDR